MTEIHKERDCNHVRGRPVTTAAYNYSFNLLPFHHHDIPQKCLPGGRLPQLLFLNLPGQVPLLVSMDLWISVTRSGASGIRVLMFYPGA